MSNEVLTNEEIDALLDLFRAEAEPGTEPVVEDLARVVGEQEDGPVISPVDLLKPNRFSRDQIIGFERYFESAAKAIAATMSDKLRFDISCDCVGVEQIRFGKWLGQLSGPTAIYSLNMPPFELPVLYGVTTSLLYSAVDRILGGSGQIDRVPTEFTAAEFVVADAFLGPCIDRVVESFEESISATWEVAERFTNPSLAQVVATHDVVLSAYFQVSGEYMMGDMRLAIPYACLENHMAQVGRGAADGFRTEPGSMRDTLEQSLVKVDTDLSVQLGKSHLSLKDLMGLAVGDVVPLDTRVGESLVAPVQGVPKFRGHIGTQGPRFAYRIAELLES